MKTRIFGKQDFTASKVKAVKARRKFKSGPLEPDHGGRSVVPVSYFDDSEDLYFWRAYERFQENPKVKEIEVILDDRGDIEKIHQIK